MIEFDSLNPYNTLEVIVEDSPQELVKALKGIKTPIKILGFVQVGNKAGAYIMGDHRIKKGTRNVNSKRSGA